MTVRKTNVNITFVSALAVLAIRHSRTEGMGETASKSTTDCAGVVVFARVQLNLVAPSGLWDLCSYGRLGLRELALCLALELCGD